MNNNDLTKHICISIPHAGMRIPPEISREHLSADFHRLSIESSDHFTDKLYDLRDLLNCSLNVFPILPLIINANRHPDHLNETVPLFYENTPIYKAKKEPSIEQRRNFVRLYHRPFHNTLERKSKILILDGHSTSRNHRDNTDHAVNFDIIVDDMQFSKLDPPEGTRTAPHGYLETYLEELERRLPRTVKVIGNAKYMHTYGYIMANHGWDGIIPIGRRAPLLLQETDESLYIKDGFPLVPEIEALRRVFAEALSITVTKMAKTYCLR